MSMQRDSTSTIERAYQLADSGEVSCMKSLTKKLHEEGYPVNLLNGPLLIKELKLRILSSHPSIGLR